MVNNGISRETLVALHETEGIGCMKIAELWAARRVRPIREGMREADLRDCGLSAKQASAVTSSLRPERIEERQQRRRRAGIEVVTWGDKDYPRRLRRIPDPPAVLYYKGNPALFNRPSVGMVGTRLATAYGRHVAEEYASLLAGRGLTVASGLARGIDTCAHRGALHRSGGTIAVLGLPVDRIYPPENRRLYQEIAEQGLLVSEAPPDTPYHKGMFPARNRIISGISLGVIVVEAPDGSGALITATKALEAGRPVFIVAGPVTSPRSRGGLAMIREGTAKVLVDPEDILYRFRRSLRSRTNEAPEVSDGIELSEAEAAVYELLLDNPGTADDLSDETGMAPGQLHSVLLSLQMKRKIEQLPGSLFSAI